MCAPRSNLPWSTSPRLKIGRISIGSQDFYGWTGLNPAKDSEYDFVRTMVEAAGLTMESLGQ